MTIIVTAFFFVDCINKEQEKTRSSVKECNHIIHDDIVYNDDEIICKEIENVDISEFDIEFVQEIFVRENIEIKKEDFYLKKSFLLTNIEYKEDANSHLELFVYEVLFNDKRNKFPDLSETLKEKNYLTIMPETIAPHTCFLFTNDDKLFIIGYYGLSSYYELFSIDFFILYVKNQYDPIQEKR